MKITEPDSVQELSWCDQEYLHKEGVKLHRKSFIRSAKGLLIQNLNNSLKEERITIPFYREEVRYTAASVLSSFLPEES